MVVVVEDDGPGISDEFLTDDATYGRQRLFCPGISTKVTGGGTGMALTWNILHMMSGGDVQAANSAAHGGAKFTCTFPRAPESALAGQDRREAAPEGLVSPRSSLWRHGLEPNPSEESL